MVAIIPQLSCAVSRPRACFLPLKRGAQWRISADNNTTTRVSRGSQSMVVSSDSRVVFAVPVELSHGSVVRQTVRRLLAETEFSEEAVDDVILALGEAFANAVAHGSGSRYEQVGVAVWAQERSVAIELRYPGEPFDARPPGEPDLEQLTGRGRFLMASLMDGVTYDFPPGETIVRLEKQL